MGNNLCFSSCGLGKRRGDLDSISSKSRALYESFGSSENDAPYFHGYQGRPGRSDSSKYTPPESSIMNNKYFHPISTNRELSKLLNLHTLPVLNNNKFYREKISEYTEKLKINNTEKEKYSKLYRKIKEPQEGKESGPHDYEAIEEDKSATLVIEVISAWNKNHNKVKPKYTPVVEIMKLTNDIDKPDDIFKFNSKDYIEENGQYVWSKICKMKFDQNSSNSNKNIKISFYRKESGFSKTQIGSSHTISVLSALKNQDVNYRTFEFGVDDQQWNVFTRIQYIYNKEALYKQILLRLEERGEMLKEVIDRYKEQREKKNLGMRYTFKRHLSNSNLDSNMSRYSSKKLSSKSPSHYAGYYSSTKSLSNDRSLNTITG
ncbi:unnamed protein product [Moneuplotes crassus]|uniref:Uncharacterized protein n=1 Tax=Euplotes crassus TaxID=5936 RepID=A0AAD1X9Z1_EUPCR|nr:unnamed protein product [Moneuplotes crassus]